MLPAAAHPPCRRGAGYSGTAIVSREEPLSVSCGIGAEEHDGEVGVVRGAPLARWD